MLKSFYFPMRRAICVAAACASFCSGLTAMAATTIVVWQENFESTADAVLRGGSSGQRVAKPSSFTLASGDVFAVSLDSASSSRWGSLEASLDGVGGGGSRNISLAALGITAGTPYEFRVVAATPSGGGFDTGDRAAGLTLRWNSTDTAGFIPNNNADGIATTFHGGDIDDSGEQKAIVFTGVVPAGATHVFPLLSVTNVNEASANHPEVFVYIDDISFSFQRSLPPVTDPLPPHGVATSATDLDRDGNGLPDLWEALNKASGLSAAGDADSDGWSNLAEAALGTDPLDPQSRLISQIKEDAGTMYFEWSALPHVTSVLEESSDLGRLDAWGDSPLATAARGGGMMGAAISGADGKMFYRVRSVSADADADTVPDWLEFAIGAQVSSDDSLLEPQSYDTDGDGATDVTLSGDLAAVNELYRQSSATEAPTRSQASRFLIQSCFGAADLSEITRVQELGFSRWLDEQMALPANFSKPYIKAIKADFDAGKTNPALAGYASGDPNVERDFVFGLNFLTSWARLALKADDQLRQRTAFALSQILVVSRKDAGLANKPEGIADYYDLMIEHAFGSYEDLLYEVSLHPMMGRYLSHLGNRKADVSKGRFPDENYAREVMQLFTIGLWELDMSGRRVLDGDGEPIPTYSNLEITELARVFTGVNYDAANFGGGFSDDGYFDTRPMKLFATEHDFGAKMVPIGMGQHHTIPARSATDANAEQDVKDLIYQLMRHPNTAPFVSRQLIQFLVTDNPSPAYVARIAAVFANEKQGKVGHLDDVVRAILLDTEARDPLEHLRKDHFGHLREPAIRAMHLARVLRIGQDVSNMLWWNWAGGDSMELELQQEPMHAPSVFNFFRPDFRMRGELTARQLDSKVFGITDSYSAISGPNHLWKLCKIGRRNGSHYQHDPDYSELIPLANDVDALVERTSLLFCAGTMSAQSRTTIVDAVSGTANATNRVRLAVYLSLMCPEGSCLK